MPERPVRTETHAKGCKCPECRPQDYQRRDPFGYAESDPNDQAFPPDGGINDYLPGDYKVGWR